MASCTTTVSHHEFEETELRLGLPGFDEVASKKRRQTMMGSNLGSNGGDQECAPPPKIQVVGWPPVRSCRKNCFQSKSDAVYVKVSMDGAPYLRKIDLKVYKNYQELLKALENMFKCTIGVYSEREGYNGSACAPTYQDKDGDWMLVGDVPWQMFLTSCKRIRIMRGSEAKGLGCQ